MTNETNEPESTKAVAGRVNALVRFAAYLMAIFAVVAIIGLRIKNIDMSGTRLFVEFWESWLILGGMIILSARILTGGEK